MVMLSPTLLAAQDVGGNIVYTLADTARANVFMEESLMLLKAQQFDEAAKKAEQAKKIFTDLFGEGRREVAIAWHRIGAIAFYRGEYEKAEKAWESALQIQINLLGHSHEEVSATYNNLGTLKKRMGEFGEAIQYLQASLDITLKNHGEKHPDVAGAYLGIGSVYNYAGKFKEAIDYHEKALNLAKEVMGADKPELAVYYGSLGFIYRSAGAHDKAMETYRKALDLQIRLTGVFHPEVANHYNNIGAVYSDKGFFRKSIEYYNKALELQLALFGKESPFVYQTYNNLGISFADLGDYDRALQYFETALAFYLKFYGEQHPNVASYYNNTGLIYQIKGDYKNAREYLEQALKLHQGIYGEIHSNVASTYNGLGITCLSLGEYDEAIEYFEKGASILRGLFGEEHPLLVEIYTNLGTALRLNRNSDKSAYYLEKARLEAPNAYGPSHPYLADILGALGQTYEGQKRYPEAEMAYEQALKALNYPNGGSLERVSSLKELIEILTLKGAFQQKLHTEHNFPGYIFKSRQTLKEAFAAYAHQSRTISPASRANLTEGNLNINATATATNFLLHQLTDSLHYLTEAFSFAERSKAMLLYEALQEAGALQIAGIPDSLLQQEYDLRVEIAYYDTRRQEKLAQGLSQTDTALLGITSRLFGLNRSYEELKNRFERDYPQYYKAKYRQDAISAGEVRRKLLQPGQSLVEYLLGDSAIYIFLLQPEHFEVVEVKRDFPLEDWVKQMTKDGIYGYYTLPPGRQSAKKEAETIRNYTTAARQLYGKLWAPVKEKLTEQVIVIPDGLLGYLPFEALLTEAPPREGVFSAYPFLLHQHQLSYCYSATLLREMQQKQHRQAPTGQLLALAPFFQGDVRALAARIDPTDFTAGPALRDSLAALPASGEEVAAVAKIWNGKPFYGADASTALFQQLAPRYRILHLSTHGRADDRRGDYAYLAFGTPGDKGAFDKLYARGLYNITLNADMVFLSACETGIGKLQRGEGIVSLARAFAYAGAKSIVTTLWKVNDEKARDLAIAFYAQLRAGKRKDEALRLAKLSYLEKQKGRGPGAHPFFWAGFIGIGDMSSLPSE